MPEESLRRAGARRTEGLREDRRGVRYRRRDSLRDAGVPTFEEPRTGSCEDQLEKLGLPFLTLDMDISDPRGYSPEQTRTRLEAFIEILDQR